MAATSRQQCCFNPNCPAGMVVYTARGLALHLQHSHVCQQFATHLNVDRTNARKVAYQSRLAEVSGQHLDPMDWTTSTNASKPPRRPLVNPHDPWLAPIMLPLPVHDGEEEDVYFDATIADMDPSSTFVMARGAALAGATGGDDLDLLSDVESTYSYDTNQHADPFSLLDDGDDNHTTAVTIKQQCMVKLLKLLEDMECPDYALAQVIDWAHDAYQQGFNFAPTVKSRDGVLAGLYHHAQNATLLLPSVVPVELIGIFYLWI